MRTPLSPTAVAAVLALPSLALAGDPVRTALETEGDAVPGVGNLSRLDNLAVNNAGTVFGEWDTDAADTDADGVLLRDGLLLFQEGQPIAPTGATLDSFDSIQPNDAGDVAYNFFLDGPGSGFDSGVYLNDTLLIQEGDPAPGGFSPGTSWIGFFETRLNDGGHLLVVGNVDDPAIASSVDNLIVRYDLDASGAIVGSTLIAVEGDPTPFGTNITTVESGAHESAMNDAGSVIWAADTDGASGFDGFVAIDAVPIAIEGSPSPVAGRAWGSLSSPEVDLNNVGDHVYSGSLDGDTASNLLLVRNGEKFRQEGDEPPGVPGFALTSFGSGPLLLNDLGEVLWYGDWDDPDTTVDSGLFIDDTLLLREGDTVGGLVVDTIRGVQDGYAMSDDGRFIVVEVTYDGFLDGLVLITRDATGGAITACVPNDGVLDVPTGPPAIGSTTTFEMDASPYPSALSILFWSTQRITVGPGCGLLIPGIGEVLVDTAFGGSVDLPPWSGSPVALSLTWPLNPNLIGLDLYFQGVFVDATLTDPAPLRVTNGWEFTFGL